MIVGIIPARIGSKRFPKKILADIDGKPMVVHVAERAMQSKLLEKEIKVIYIQVSILLLVQGEMALLFIIEQPKKIQKKLIKKIFFYVILEASINMVLQM